jgi:hypothetical protein
MPEARRAVRPRPRKSSWLVVLGSESGRDEPRIPSSLPSTSSTKPTENVLIAPAVCLAINAATTDGQTPLSITPAGRRPSAEDAPPRRAPSTASAAPRRPGSTSVGVQESPTALDMATGV